MCASRDFSLLSSPRSTRFNGSETHHSRFLVRLGTRDIIVDNAESILLYISSRPYLARLTLELLQRPSYIIYCIIVCRHIPIWTKGNPFTDTSVQISNQDRVRISISQWRCSSLPQTKTLGKEREQIMARSRLRWR